MIIFNVLVQKSKHKQIEKTSWEVFKAFTRGWGWVKRWEPLLDDFILLAEKLDKLGFTYANDQVVLIEGTDIFKDIVAETEQIRSMLNKGSS